MASSGLVGSIPVTAFTQPRPKYVDLFLIKKQEKERELKGWGGAGERERDVQRDRRYVIFTACKLAQI